MGAHIRLSDGSLRDPFTMKVSDPRPPRTVFTRALSILPRYTGHSLYPYTVAQHTVALARSKEVKAQGLQRAALLHDFSEAFMNDLASPVKRALPEYGRKEVTVQRVIFDWWGEPWENMILLDDFDKRMCINEMRVLFPDTHQDWAEPLDAHVFPEMHWRSTFQMFEFDCDQSGVEA